MALFWQGEGVDDRMEYEVRIGVRNTLLTEHSSNGTRRYLTLRLNTTKGSAPLASIYALMLASTTNNKDKLYEDHINLVSSTLNEEQLI
jgi:uncharacterized protein YccT (UPF0319 family)